VASNASGQSGRFARSRWQPGPVDYDSARFDINLDVFFTVRVSIGAPPRTWQCSTRSMSRPSARSVDAAVTLLDRFGPVHLCTETWPGQP
jgi:hypothetical protein